MTKNKLPPLPSLRMALVCMVDGTLARKEEAIAKLKLKSTDGLRRIAVIARDLSSHGFCFFCAEARPKLKATKKAPAWDTIQICSCLDDLRSGYVEDFPSWETTIGAQGIREAVDSREMVPHRKIYSDACRAMTSTGVCGARFTITAGSIATAMRNNPDRPYMRSTKCKECVNKARAKRGMATIPGARQEAAVVNEPKPVPERRDPGAKPPRREPQGSKPLTHKMPIKGNAAG